MLKHLLDNNGMAKWLITPTNCSPQRLIFQICAGDDIGTNWGNLNKYTKKPGSWSNISEKIRRDTRKKLPFFTKVKDVNKRLKLQLADLPPSLMELLVHDAGRCRLRSAVDRCLCNVEHVFRHYQNLGTGADVRECLLTM